MMEPESVLPSTRRDKVHEACEPKIKGLEHVPLPLVTWLMPTMGCITRVCVFDDWLVTVYCIVAEPSGGTLMVVAVNGVNVHKGLPASAAVPSVMSKKPKQAFMTLQCVDFIASLQ